MGASTCFVCRCFIFVRAVYPLISLQNRCYFLRLSDDHEADQTWSARGTRYWLYFPPLPLSRVFRTPRPLRARLKNAKKCINEKNVNDGSTSSEVYKNECSVLILKYFVLEQLIRGTWANDRRGMPSRRDLIFCFLFLFPEQRFHQRCIECCYSDDIVLHQLGPIYRSHQTHTLQDHCHGQTSLLLLDCGLGTRVALRLFTSLWMVQIPV